MTINISDEAIHKISKKIEEMEKVLEDSDELEYLELLKVGGPNVEKYLRGELLTTKEAKSAIVLSMTIMLISNDFMEEICEKYPDAEEWWNNFQKVEA